MAHVALPKSERIPVPGYVRAGKSHPDDRVEVSVYVRRNPAGPTVPAIDHVGAQLPLDRMHLGRAELDAIFGADAADLAKIEAFAFEHHLEVRALRPPQRRILLSGRVADLEAAFGVELHTYRHEHGLGSYRGREGPVLVPEALAGIVEGVFGLDDRKLGRSRSRRKHGPAGHNAFPPANALPANTYYPAQVAQLYDFPAADGSGQTIGIIAFNDAKHGGGYSVPAVEKYLTQILRQPMPAITDVVVRGPGNVPGRDDAHANPDDNTSEIMLDVQIAAAFAPGAKIVVYFSEFTEQGWVDCIHAAVTDDAHDPDLLSCSFGNAESGAGTAFTRAALEQIDQAFQAAAARGITVCVASGDDGTEDDVKDRRAHADFPAASPYVLGCGGTRVEARDGAIVREVAWNDKAGVSGGGVSEVFPLPGWQANAGVPPSANTPHVTGRGVPDVSGLADPETGVLIISVDGETAITMGGTSLTAPLWAALLARINQSLGKRVGYLNPLLYTRFPTGVLRDVVSGTNGAYTAGVGWDAVTGLGSPDGGRLLAALRGAPIT
jgi:kumamolisin